MWFAEAPSNIALIKYMGKEDSERNIPLNPSLSYCLNELKSFVSLEPLPHGPDRWEMLQIPGTPGFELDVPAQKRFLAHLTYLKEIFKYDGYFVVRSTNNFPMSAGLASSASSFAALTKAAVLALCELTNQEEFDASAMAKLSRHASGSSCRSFFKPWALWSGETCEAIDLPVSNLIHHVVLVSKEEKAVSSSEAHKRVLTSPYYSGRKERAEKNLKDLLTGLRDNNWRQCYEVCWHEFMDMHHLFDTAKESFNYINEDTNNILEQLQQYWDTHNDGPLVTMDAGPNVHLLFREDQAELANDMHLFLISNHDIL